MFLYLHRDSHTLRSASACFKNSIYSQQTCHCSGDTKENNKYSVQLRTQFIAKNSNAVKKGSTHSACAAVCVEHNETAKTKMFSLLKYWIFRSHFLYPQKNRASRSTILMMHVVLVLPFLSKVWAYKARWLWYHVARHRCALWTHSEYLELIRASTQSRKLMSVMKTHKSVWCVLAWWSHVLRLSRQPAALQNWKVVTKYT